MRKSLTNHTGRHRGRYHLPVTNPGRGAHRAPRVSK